MDSYGGQLLGNASLSQWQVPVHVLALDEAYEGRELFYDDVGVSRCVALVISRAHEDAGQSGVA